jgi:hypothetical protein
LRPVKLAGRSGYEGNVQWLLLIPLWNRLICLATYSFLLHLTEFTEHLTWSGRALGFQRWLSCGSYPCTFHALEGRL